jgi:hypothetical protein
MTLLIVDASTVRGEPHDLFQYFRLMFEAGGFLPTRAALDVKIDAPFRLGSVMAFTQDGQLHEVREQ